MFTIEMLPARNGDSLWVEYGDQERPSRFLIDGGISSTFNIIEEKIHRIAEVEGICKLELLVVTHIDADHIEGVVRLLGKPSLPLEIGDIWFNGAEHLPDDSEQPENEFLGATQGEFLSALIRERRLPWNQAFGGKTIFVPDTGRLPRKTLPGGMQLTLLSPRLPELVTLSKEWDKVLEEKGLQGATQEEVLEALKKDRKLRPDDEFLSGMDVETLLVKREKFDSSEANGSSIALIAEFDGKSCLLAGDAYSTVLQEGAQRAAAEVGVEKIRLDAHKVAHHGSGKNIHNALFESMVCHRLLVSTNGSRFKHPDAVAVARMVGGKWRGDNPQSDEPVEICFNYRSRFNEAWDDDTLRQEWNYKTIYSPQGSDGGLLVEL